MTLVKVWLNVDPTGYAYWPRCPEQVIVIMEWNTIQGVIGQVVSKSDECEAREVSKTVGNTKTKPLNRAPIT